MPQFLLQCLDAPGVAAERTRLREDHVAHVRGSGRTRLAGPILGEGDAVRGSWLVIEATDLADAGAFSQADPFRQAGVYETVEIRPIRITYVALDGDAAGSSGIRT